MKKIILAIVITAAAYLTGSAFGGDKKISDQEAEKITQELVSEMFGSDPGEKGWIIIESLTSAGYTATDDLWQVMAANGFTATDDLWKILNSKGYSISGAGQSEIYSK